MHKDYIEYSKSRIVYTKKQVIFLYKILVRNSELVDFMYVYLMKILFNQDIQHSSQDTCFR